MMGSESLEVLPVGKKETSNGYLSSPKGAAVVQANPRAEVVQEGGTDDLKLMSGVELCVEVCDAEGCNQPRVRSRQRR